MIINKIYKIIPLFLILLNCIFQHSGYSQTQLNIPEYITQRFNEYCKSVPREEIFIHTDKEEYIAGENLWFNAYLIDRQSHMSSSNSKIFYFELLNSENKSLVQKRILIENGFGPGEVVIPDTISSGVYTIRAYTNWMKNFFPDNCFQTKIEVYNSLRPRPFMRGIKLNEGNVTDTSKISADSGEMLKVNNLLKESLEIYIQSDEKFRSENKNLVYLLIETHGIINHLFTERITEETTKIVIPKVSLPSGINQITLFDSKGPVADRFIYTPSIEKQMLTLSSVNSCNKREKVTIEIEIGHESPEFSESTNLSISVASGKYNLGRMDINDYLVFGTEFGSLPMSLLNGRKINELPPEAIDSIMLKLKSNWIIWKSVFSNEKQLFKYPQEKNDHFITGRLLTSNLQPEKADEILLMSIPGREAAFQYTTTDREGYFNFRIHIDEDIKDLIIQPDIASKNQKVYIEQSFSNQYFPSESYVDTTVRSRPSYIERESINYIGSKIFGSSSIGERTTPVIPPRVQKRFYGTPDFVLIMGDYIKLDSMQEVFFELVPHVTMNLTNSVYAMSVADATRKILSNGSPGIMLDGVIIRDLSTIANLDPGLVDKIDVVWDEYRVGGYLFNGIVNVISKSGDFSNGILPFGAVRLKDKVINPVKGFVSPDYSSQEMRNSPVADFRNTLYWNPSVKPDKNGKVKVYFWSADVKSDYIINIQGITSEGKALSQRKIFKVK
jgi:hypothetical protein